MLYELDGYDRLVELLLKNKSEKLSIIIINTTISLIIINWFQVPIIPWRSIKRVNPQLALETAEGDGDPFIDKPTRHVSLVELLFRET